MTFPITVLMTVYNNEPFLKEAIQSILNQTFGNFEFLIIDDASRDRSQEIVQSFTDRRIRFVANEKNLGQSTSLNLGLKMAKGYYIARMDADDISLPKRLETQYAFALSCKKPLGVLGTQISYINEEGRSIHEPWMSSEEGDILWKLLYTSPLVHSSAFFDKEGALLLGGYDTQFSYVQDSLLWFQFALQKRLVMNLDGKPLVLARLYANSTTSRANERKNWERKYYTKFVLSKLFGWNLDDVFVESFHYFLNALPFKKTGPDHVRKLMQLTQECHKKLTRFYVIPNAYKNTLLRIGLFGKEIGFCNRLRLFREAIRSGGLKGKGGHFSLSSLRRGFRFFYLRGRENTLRNDLL